MAKVTLECRHDIVPISRLLEPSFISGFPTRLCPPKPEEGTDLQLKSHNMDRTTPSCTRHATLSPVIKVCAEDSCTVLAHLSTMGTVPNIVLPRSLFPCNSMACICTRARKQEGLAVHALTRARTALPPGFLGQDLLPFPDSSSTFPSAT
jgi:hypothetical protein